MLKITRNYTLKNNNTSRIWLKIARNLVPTLLCANGVSMMKLTIYYYKLIYLPSDGSVVLILNWSPSLLVVESFLDSKNSPLKSWVKLRLLENSNSVLPTKECSLLKNASNLRLSLFWLEVVPIWSFLKPREVSMIPTVSSETWLNAPRSFTVVVLLNLLAVLVSTKKLIRSPLLNNMPSELSLML